MKNYRTRAISTFFAAVAATGIAAAVAPTASAEILNEHPHGVVEYNDAADEICIKVNSDLTFRVHTRDSDDIEYRSEVLHPGQTLCVRFYGLPEDTPMYFVVTGEKGSGAYAQVFYS